jgi:importin subunit alpha-1
MLQQRNTNKQLKDESRISQTTSKQKRIDRQQVNLKNRRQKMIAKRRKTALGRASLSQQDDLKKQVFGPQGHAFLTQLVNELDDTKHTVRIKALKTLRTILSFSGGDTDEGDEVEQEEDVVTNCLSIPRFLPLINKHLCCANNESQLEAAWCLTNIASSTHEHTKAVLPSTLQLITYLENAEPIVQEQCAWALGNIAGDSSDYAQLLIRNGILKPLSNLLRLKISDLIKTVNWCLSNIIRGVLSSHGDKHTGSELQYYDLSIFFHPDYDLIPSLLKHLQSENEGVAIEAAWSLCYLANHQDYNYVAQLLQQNLLPIVIAILSKNDSEQLLRLRVGITLPVLRILGTIARGPDQVIESIFLSKDIRRLLNTLMFQIKLHEEPAIQKETVWVLSNLAAGTPNCVDMLTKAGFVPVLLQFCVNTNTDNQFDLKKESLYALLNICNDFRLMDMQIIESMMTGIQQVLSKMVEQSVHDSNNEQFAIVCLNFISFVQQVSATRIADQQRQEQIKKWIPYTVVQQFQQRYTTHQAYQQISRTILQCN